MMDAFYLTLDSAEFRLYSTPEILQLSVKEIKISATFDRLSNPVMGGLHDPALGPLSYRDVCGSCGQSESRCPGHFGHIRLPVLLYNPVLLKQLLTILQGTCLFCHKVMLPDYLVKAYKFVTMLIRKGLFVEADNATNKYLNGEPNVTDLENDLEKFAKKCDKTHNVYSKNIRTSVKDRLERISTILKKSSVQCPHCQNVNRSLKFQRKTTIIGTKMKRIMKTHRPRENLIHTDNCREKKEKAEIDDNSMFDDEVEMDGEEEPKMESNLEEESQEGFMDVDSEIEKFTSSVSEKAILSPFVAQVHLRKVWAKEAEFLKVAFPFLAQVSGLESATDIFFLDVLPVTPSRFRPLNVRGDSKFEHQHTVKLSNTIAQSEKMVEMMEDYGKIVLKLKTPTGPSDQAQLQKSLNDATRTMYALWLKLQNTVNTIFDQNMDESTSRDIVGGVRQLVEKKQGLFRNNFMGKRVNYSARSIISPDPYIATNQVGVPLVFASTLTYPQPVTPWNVHVLRQLVINGPKKYPGAFSVINENGSVQKLSENDQSQREAIANQLLVTENDVPNRKTVCRHLLNGDYVLMNRQPTLHRPSIQAHKARVLRGLKAFRLHYSNCKAYNADFDGDEMNLHFPQDELSRAEAATLVGTDFQYLVPKDGTPLGGLIQDHMVAGVTLTTRGRFFNKDEYCRLLWGAMSDTSQKLELLPPSILKPRALWSGKQVISSIILNIIPKDRAPLNLNGKTKIPEKSWTIPELVRSEKVSDNLKDLCSNELGESVVVFRQGELLQGVLDKAHYGPSAYGLVHSCYELYGGEIAGKLLTYLGRLFATFLQMIGFSLGVGDILVQRKGDKERKSIIKGVRSLGKQAMSKALTTGQSTEMSKPDMLGGYRQAHFSKDNLKMAEIDMYVKKETDQIQDAITKSIMPVGLQKRFPQNSLQLMVQSGAKGSPVNCMQISCLLGQIELEGRRPPLMMSGRALPCFRPYATSPYAGGFVTGRFLTGIRPSEYFFHCMAGREGLIDTAVKTSRSGYLQRCLVKHLEGIMVNYDLTVRDTDGSVVQFYYGEDGIDATKSSYLKPAQFPFLADNLKALQHGSDNPWESFDSSKSIKKAWKKITKWGTHTNEERTHQARDVGFPEFCSSLTHEDSVDEDKATLITKGQYSGRSALSRKHCKAWYELEEDQRLMLSKVKTCPDPVMSSHFPHSQPNILSEDLRQKLDKFCKTELDRSRVDRNVFMSAINKKIVQSMSDPGEAVGLICAQSVGEPSTQMTLNTFHFAGRGEMNVTLGIPRLREILMTGSRMPQTPQTDVPIRDVPQAMKLAEKLKAELTSVTLNQVLEYMKFNVNIVSKSSQNFKEVQVTFKCLHHSQYREICNMKFTSVVNYIVTRFVPLLEAAVRKENKILKSSSLFASGNMKRAAYMRGADDQTVGEENGDEPNDGDTQFMKEKQRQSDTIEYEGEDEEIKEVHGEDTDVSDGEYANTDSEESSNEDSEKEDKEQDVVPEVSKKEHDKLIFKAMSHNSVMAMKFEDKEKRCFTLTFKYPPEDLQFDLKLLFETLVKSCIIQQVPGIKQVFISKEIENGKTVLHLKTDGINLQYLFKYPYLLDLNRLYCNSIHHMRQFYGIEAANRSIIKEIQNVFGAYGIMVDYHHLSLLADYMTNRGDYDAFNRMGIDKSQASMLQRITFETSMNFLMDACINNDKDYLKSPSAQLSIGKPISIGTGCFDVLVK